MSKHYETEFKKKIVRLHFEDCRFLKSLAAEYGVLHVSISNWTNQFRIEYQTNEEANIEYDYMKEDLQSLVGVHQVRWGLLVGLASKYIKFSRGRTKTNE